MQELDFLTLRSNNSAVDHTVSINLGLKSEAQSVARLK